MNPAQNRWDIDINRKGIDDGYGEGQCHQNRKAAAVASTERGTAVHLIMVRGGGRRLQGHLRKNGNGIIIHAGLQRQCDEIECKKNSDYLFCPCHLFYPETKIELFFTSSPLPRMGPTGIQRSLIKVRYSIR